MSITYSSPYITITGGKDSGTASAGSTTTLTDSSKSWATNAFANYDIAIVTGTGLNQVARIISNTATVLTFDLPVVIAPANGSTYIIQYTLADVKAANDAGTWGQVTQTQETYTIAQRLTIGDTSTVSGLSIVGKKLLFSNAQPGFAITTNGILTQGLLKDGMGYAGGEIHMPNAPSSTGKAFTRSGVSATVDWYFQTGSKWFCYQGLVMYNTRNYASDHAYGIRISLEGNAHCDIRDSIFHALYRIENQSTDFALKRTRFDFCRSAFGIFQTPDIENVTIDHAFWGMAITKPNVTMTFDGLNMIYNKTGGVYVNIWMDNADRSKNTILEFIDSNYFNYTKIHWQSGYNSKVNFRQSFDIKTVDSSEADLSGVVIYLEDSDGTERVNVTTGSNGKPSSIPLVISNTEIDGSSTTYNPYIYKRRKYGYSFTESVRTFSKGIEGEISQESTNLFVVASSPTAAGYNVQFDGVTKVITNTGKHTQQEVYDAGQYWASLSANMQYSVPLETFDGVNFLLGSGWSIATTNNFTFDSTSITIPDAKVQSTTTGGSATTLVDSTQSWTTNEWVGRLVWIRSGAGIYSQAEILSNTTTTLTVGAFVRYTSTGLQTYSIVSGTTYSIGYNFQDMIDDFVEGISKSGDNSYTLTKKLNISGTGFLHDHSILLSQDVGTTPLGIQLASTAYLQWGYLDKNDSTKGGISWIFNTNESQSSVANNFSSAGAAGVFRMYASSATVTAPHAGRGSFWRVHNGSGGQVDLKDVLFNTFKGGIRVQGDDSRAKNVTFIDQSTTAGPLNFVGAIALADNINIQNSDYAFYWYQGYAGPTVRGLSSIDVGYTILVWGGSSTGGLKLIDYSGDPLTFQSTNSPNDTQKIEEIYTYTPTTVDSLSSVLENVRLYIEDSLSTGVINKLSDVDGCYTENLLYRGKYKASLAGVITLETPHTIKFRKYGYLFQKFIFTADSPFKSNVGLVTNTVVQATEAEASAYTGIAVDGVSKTVTLSISRTMQYIYDYCEYWAVQLDNIQYDSPFKSVDGLNFTITNGWIFILDVALSGSVNLSGTVQSGDIDLSDMSITGDLHINTGADSVLTYSNIQVSDLVYNDDSSHTLTINAIDGSILSANDPGTGVGQIGIQNAVTLKVKVLDSNTKATVDGVRVFLETVNTSTELLNALTVDGIVSTAYNYTGNMNIRGWARRATTSPIYTSYQLSGTITSQGYDVTILMSRED